MRCAAALILFAFAGCGAETETTTTIPAATQALARIGHGESFALAGDTVLHARVRDRAVEVRAGERVVHRFEAPAGTWVETRMLASPQLAVLQVEVEEKDGGARSIQAFAGPPGGPLEALIPLSRPARTDYFP